ncbi:MAG: VOC family protein [Rhodospirillales bacterium]|nr:VOC family protein [Rhodospirillales bacterium]
MTLTPTIDHVVINVHDAMDAAEARFRALGFTLTPRGHHTLGSINHLATFGTDYLELIGAPEQSRRLDILAWPTGLNGLVFASENAAATEQALTDAGVAHEPPGSFSRPVATPLGARDASFTTVRLRSETTPAGRLYFCQHHTRGLVWDDAWRNHPNGAIGVAEVIVAAHDPGRLGDLFARMFGPRAVRHVAGGIRLKAALADILVLDHGATAARIGGLADTRDEAMAALVLRVSDLGATRAVLGGRDRIGPEEAFGTTLLFRE